MNCNPTYKISIMKENGKKREKREQGSESLINRQFLGKNAREVLIKN